MADYEYAIDNWRLVMPCAAQFMKEEITCDADKTELEGMVVKFLQLGLAKRREWGDVWMQPPMCFGLIMDELYGPSAASVFLQLAGKQRTRYIHNVCACCGKVKVEIQPVFDRLYSIFKPYQLSISYWFVELGFSAAGCLAEFQNIAGRISQVEEHGDRRPTHNHLHRPLHWWSAEYPEVTTIMKRELLCVRIHQMVLENLFSKIAACLEESLQPTQLEAAIKYMQNVIFPMEKAARDMHPMVHKSLDHKSKWKSPGLSSAQITFLCDAMNLHCAQYSKLPAGFFIASKEARKRNGNDDAHNRDYHEFKKAKVANRRAPRANAKKRDVESMLAAGASHSIAEIRAVGNASSSVDGATANENNPLHYSFFSKIKVRNTGGSTGACFSNLVDQITHHHPGFDPQEAGVATSKFKVA